MSDRSQRLVLDVGGDDIVSTDPALCVTATG